MSDKNQRDNVSGEETSQLFSKEELLAEIAQMVSKQTNAAITQRLSSFEAKQESTLNEIRTSLANFAPKSVEDSGKSSKAAKEKDPEFLALQKKMEAMEAKEAKLVAEQREVALRKNLSEQLTKAGVDPRFMKAAIATLVAEDKLVGYTSDEFAQDKDAIVWKSKSGEQDLVSGLRDWIRSDEGKTYVAPKGVQGSGDKSYSASKQTNGGTMSDSALASLLTNLRNG